MNKSIHFLEWSLGLLIVIISASTSAEQITESALAEIVFKLVEENKQLRQEIDKLRQHRDVETDIEEIKKVLESYGEDLTTLRIQQGRLVETVQLHDNTLLEHNISLMDHTNSLIDHTSQITYHTEKLTQHDNSIGENKATIEVHTQTLNGQGANLQWAIDNINGHAGTLAQHDGSIAANSQNIQAVTDSFNSYRNSLVKFYAESGCCDIEKWPDNARITYQNVPIDTHGAVYDGQFHAPITGLYSFTFTADFRLYPERPEFASVHLNVNENNIRSYLYDSRTNDGIYFSFSIAVTLRLNQGDRVDFSTSGEPCLDFSRNPAAFHGYLLQVA